MLFRKCPNCDINHWFISQFGHLYSKKSPWLFYEESNIAVVRIQYEIGQAISSFKDIFSLFHSRLVMAGFNIDREEINYQTSTLTTYFSYKKPDQ